ncbi:MarR family transcriptional regulator [Clostridium magnum]|uniref:MarR family protein n=1 Tax=Clostridium magnum DSM 2767 TaxID=1121326 RepID=A0A162RBX8_9CLOT|nr:MarR family transcriptional regulator [Clostridium magnum]KZL89687.1 MarR family protein [Clostridium magnum DSM 2767]SHH76419.1 MarR family protein [Clostridium magnum DSM 2767]
MALKEDSPYQNDELVSKQADEIIEIFKSIKKTLSCKFEKNAKQYGFTAPQLGVIFHLHHMPSITLNELSEHMMLTKSTVSGIVDRLTKQGVVVREIPKDNRRTVKLSISEEFKKNNDICNMKKTFISDLISNGIKNMDPMEVEKIIYGLKQFSLLLNDDNSK